MKKAHLLLPVVFALFVLVTAGTAIAGKAVRVEDAIWANDQLFSTIVTDTSFNSPPAHSTDVIYSFMMSGLGGQRSVADSSPGDPDFNGGRWSVKAVVFTPQGLAVHDADGNGIADFELTNAAQVTQHEALGHIIIMDTPIYFECPLLP